MTATEYWLAGGGPVSRPTQAGMTSSEERRFLRAAANIKVDVEREGTRVSWCQFAANWASLFYVIEWLPRLPAPVILEFFNAGWFSERYPTVEGAITRIEQLIATSDVQLSTRTFIGANDSSIEAMPIGLRDAWTLGAAPVEKSVICSVDTVLERSEVTFVGPRSALANVWGLSAISYPCQTGHSYDRTVSRPYYDVVKRDRPHRDHVLASMIGPTGEIRWYGYQRVIFPGSTNAVGKPTVRVMCETAQVDFRIP